MKLDFQKYSGTGNDFVIIDNRNGVVDPDDQELMAILCDRRFGVGADGVMLLSLVDGYDFEMKYFNADGSLGSMCGNGGRCISAYAHSLGIVDTEARFLGFDGEHRASIQKLEDGEAFVTLSMNDITAIEEGDGFYFLDTGSPHYVTYVNDVWDYDVFNEGSKIRNNERFKKEGTNVDFIEYKEGLLHVRTFERGVEDETLCCGTGVTASALVASLHGDLNGEDGVCPIKAAGGKLNVHYERNGNTFTNIRFEGLVQHIFDGSIDV